MYIRNKLKYFINESLNTNFYKWFGNSKIVDDNGKPLIVYHGSPSVFNKFETFKKVAKILFILKF